MNHFQVNALYYLAATVTLAIFIVLSFVAVTHAVRKHLTRYLAWLVPFTAANSLQFGMVLWRDWYFFTGSRGTMVISLVMSVITFAAWLIGLYGAKRLLDFVKDAPEHRGETPPLREDVPQAGVWPPPPRVRRSGE